MTVPLTVAAVALASLFAVPAVCVGLRLPRRLGLAWAWRRLKPRLLGLGLMAKFKVLASFYQIVTNISPVYQVEFPRRVAEVVHDARAAVEVRVRALVLPPQVPRLQREGGGPLHVEVLEQHLRASAAISQRVAV